MEEAGDKWSPQRLCSAVCAARLAAGMSAFDAMWIHFITATVVVAAQAVAAAAMKTLSSLTGSPDSSFASQASTQGPITPSSQLASEGLLVLEGVKIAAVCLASLALAWRIWGILKNTEAWRSLLVLLGADPAPQPQPDDEAAAHCRLLIDGDPIAGVELALGPAPTAAGTAGASTATDTQLAMPNFNVSELSGVPGCLPGAIFTRECTWTCTSSSMSTRECHYSQPASTRSA